MGIGGTEPEGIIFVYNFENDSSLRHHRENISSEMKALKIYHDNFFGLEIDVKSLINTISKELNMKKSEAEFVTDRLIWDGWLRFSLLLL